MSKPKSDARPSSEGGKSRGGTSRTKGSKFSGRADDGRRSEPGSKKKSVGTADGAGHPSKKASEVVTPKPHISCKRSVVEGNAAKAQPLSKPTRLEEIDIFAATQGPTKRETILDIARATSLAEQASRDSAAEAAAKKVRPADSAHRGSATQQAEAPKGAAVVPRCESLTDWKSDWGKSSKISQGDEAGGKSKRRNSGDKKLKRRESGGNVGREVKAAPPARAPSVKRKGSGDVEDKITKKKKLSVPEALPPPSAPAPQPVKPIQPAFTSLDAMMGRWGLPAGGAKSVSAAKSIPPKPAAPGGGSPHLLRDVPQLFVLLCNPGYAPLLEHACAVLRGTTRSSKLSLWQDMTAAKYVLETSFDLV